MQHTQHTHRKGNTMLKTIKGLLQKVLYQPTELETFISSKNPQNAGDIDHWMRVYDQRKGDCYGF
jgi:hypothetical protein